MNMYYYSLNGHPEAVDFRTAAVRGLAPDRGLYFPERVPDLPRSAWRSLPERSDLEIGRFLLEPYVAGSLDSEGLEAVLRATLDFPFPLVEVEPGISALELFHGPTLAFKDVGARFMARCLGRFLEDSDGGLTVLVATSGDTGGAVANGFLGVDGISVVILYPEGKVSDLQERQLTTLGNNVRAVRVAGAFDDCQELVKTAFLDQGLQEARPLTSANSINVARWLPQMCYFAIAYARLGAPDDLVFSVPSGNYGNLCAGMLAHRMGMPVRRFVAATNANTVIPRFLASGRYEPLPTVPTVSNAMDVGDPSNFVRIQALFGERPEALSPILEAHGHTDAETLEALAELHARTGYLCDPHGAVGYLGLKRALADFGTASEKSDDRSSENPKGIFLETAHPVKFLDIVQGRLGLRPEIPAQVAGLMEREPEYDRVEDYAELKALLLRTAP